MINTPEDPAKRSRILALKLTFQSENEAHRIKDLSWLGRINMSKLYKNRPGIKGESQG